MIKVWARVGCTFELDCEPTAAAIEEALKEAVSKIPYADGETIVPWSYNVHCVQTMFGKKIFQPDDEEDPLIDVTPVDREPKYVLYGRDAVTRVNNDEFEELKEELKEDVNSYVFELKEWPWDEPVNEIMNHCDGWSDWCYITREQYDVLSEI
jgi:hypothetical protein